MRLGSHRKIESQVITFLLALFLLDSLPKGLLGCHTYLLCHVDQKYDHAEVEHLDELLEVHDAQIDLTCLLRIVLLCEKRPEISG